MRRQGRPAPGHDSADVVGPAADIQGELEALLKCQESLAARVAKVMGESSAAAKALADLARRRALGENVIVYPVQNVWLVGKHIDIAQALLASKARYAKSGHRPDNVSLDSQ